VRADKKPTPLRRALLAAFGRRYLLVARWKLGYWASTLAQPLAIAALLAELQGKTHRVDPKFAS
jgi:hypothetical protein